MLVLREVNKTDVDSIVVLDRCRHPTPEQVKDMAASLKQHGLLTPIGVRIVDELEFEGESIVKATVLVYGATRLAAAKHEGWKRIDTQILEGSDLDFKKAEIIENLHRADLTPVERDEWRAALVKICEEEEAQRIVRQVGAVSEGGRGKKGGVREAAREIGKPEATVRRAVKTAGIAEAAKAALKAAHKDTQSARLEVAEETTPEAQIAKAREIAEKKRTQPPARTTASQQRNDQDKVAAAETYLQSWDATKRGLRTLSAERRREIVALMRRDLDELENLDGAAIKRSCGATTLTAM